MLFRPDCKGVELHIHLDACCRPETLFELAQKKQIDLPYKTVNQLVKELLPKDPPSLANFLQGFDIILQILKGDKDAIRRITMECIEDCVEKGKLCYVELRFSPHILATETCSPDEITACVLDAMEEASNLYSIEVRLILCIMRLQPEMAPEVIDLAIKYHEKGVVAIDVAGDDASWKENMLPPEIKDAFDKAKRMGIHRTVHAGENSPAKAVIEAIDTLHAERIGHGYAIVHDDIIYNRVQRSRVHIETCPNSSWLTGAVKRTTLKTHPTCRFAKNEFNYSVNTDGPLMIQRWLPDEFECCRRNLSMTNAELKQAQLNAAEAIFLDDMELKESIIAHVKKQ